MNHVGKNRLLKLADKLDEVAADKKLRKQFNMDSWKEEDNDSCGFTACAVGTGVCCIPSFRKAGLKLTKSPWQHIEGKTLFLVSYKGFPDFEGVKEFFKLDNFDEADYLFSSEYYPLNMRKSPKFVANRIRSYIKKKETGEGITLHYYSED